MLHITKNQAIWLIYISLLIFALRLPSSTAVVIDPDESTYFTVAQDIVNGGVPYKTAWEDKGPILYFLFVPIIKLFGNNIFALRIFTTFYLLATMLFVFFIAKRLFKGRITLLAPLIYGLFFTASKLGGLASNAEIFMMLPATMAVFYVVDYTQNKKNAAIKLFLCGCLSAIAFFIKATSVFTVMILPVTLIYKKFTSKQYTWRAFLKEILFYSLGWLIISLIIAAYLLYHQALVEFYKGYFVFNTRRVTSIPVETGLLRLMLFLLRILIQEIDYITWIALISASFILIRKYCYEIQEDTVDFILGLAILSLVGAYWRRNIHIAWHNFLQMGLPFSLLVPLALSIVKINITYLNKITYIVVVAILCAIPVKDIIKFPDAYKNRNKNMYNEVAEYIRAHTKSSDPIFVMGEQAIIYFLSERMSPTKYLFYLHHYGQRQKWLGIKDSTMVIFNRNKPVYFVYEDRGWRNELFEDFIRKNYHFEKRIGDYILYRVNG